MDSTPRLATTIVVLLADSGCVHLSVLQCVSLPSLLPASTLGMAYGYKTSKRKWCVVLDFCWYKYQGVPTLW
eukprot:1241131-Rhodomonas_salina.1